MVDVFVMESTGLDVITIAPVFNDAVAVATLMPNPEFNVTLLF
jgi:hypothetical protein